MTAIHGDSSSRLAQVAALDGAAGSARSSQANLGAATPASGAATPHGGTQATPPGVTVAAAAAATTAGASGGGASPTSPVSDQKILRRLAVHWLTGVLLKTPHALDKTKSDGEQLHDMRNGQALCRAMNVLQPSEGPIVVNEAASPYASIENLNAFLTAITRYGVDRQGCFRIATIQSATGGRGEDELARTLLHLAILATEKYHVTVPGFQLAVAHEALAKCHAASETSGSSETQPGSASSPKPLRARHSTMAAESPVSGSNHSIASHATGHGAHGGTSAHAGAGAAAHGLTAASSLPSSSQRRAKAQEAMRLKFQSIADYVNRDLAALTKRLNDIEALQIAVAMALQTQQTTPSPQVAMLLTHLADAASENNGVGEGDEDDEDDDVSVCRMADSDADGLAINTLQESTPKTSASPNASPQAASTPKVFKAVPEELLNAGLPKIELLRLSAVYELIETEADYVRDLGIMIDFYKTQIRQTQMVTEEELSILFSNVDQLVGPNQGLLRTLNTAKEANNRLPEVGPCLIECAEAFTVYTTYCGNYQTAMKLLSNLQARPEFKEHLNRWMASPSSRGLSLESFLIKPVQRICKYPLIVREIQRHTDAQSPDQALLTTAMAKVEAVVSVVNEATRALGERERLAGLQARIEAPFNLGLTERKVLRDGPLSRFASGKSRERYVIACADILLICKPKEKGRYTLEDLYANHELSVKPMNDPKLRFAFQLTENTERHECIQLLALTAEDQTKWVETLENAIARATEGMGRREKRTSTGHAPMSLEAAKRTSTMSSFSSFDLNSGMGTIRIKGRLAGKTDTTMKAGKWATMKRKMDMHDPVFESVHGLDAHESVAALPEPDLVLVAGQRWKKARSATGQVYYYNTATKETTWHLPDGWIELDPETGEPVAPGGHDDEPGTAATSPTVAATATDASPDAAVPLLAPASASASASATASTSALSRRQPSTAASTGGGADETPAAAVAAPAAAVLSDVPDCPGWQRVENEGVVYYFHITTQETRWTPPEGARLS